MDRKAWTYGTNIATARAYLSGSETFESLAEEIKEAINAASAAQIRFEVEPRNGNYKGDDPILKRIACRRGSWHIPLEETLLDRFFNGRMGIRAQYYSSPFRGRAANQALLRGLYDRLIEFALASGNADQQLLELTLSQPSAKTWVSEKNLKGEKIIRASDLSLDEQSIQNDWLTVARMVKSGAITGGDYNTYCAALTGVRAPIPDQLEVKGAWISERERVDYVTADKRDRDLQIFMFGFT